MSSHEVEARRPGRLRVAAAMVVAASLALAGCTVQPLYQSSGGLEAPSQGTGIAAQLSQVAIAPVSTREALEVRNHLTFLLGGGSRPSEPLYTLTLGVISSSSAAARIQRSDDDEPTARVVTMASNYVLVDARTGRAISRGLRQTTSSYDVPRQEFAALRAQRDAENRAARELAELLRHALAQDLSRLPAS